MRVCMARILLNNARASGLSRATRKDARRWAMCDLFVVQQRFVQQTSHTRENRDKGELVGRAKPESQRLIRRISYASIYPVYVNNSLCLRVV